MVSLFNLNIMHGRNRRSALFPLRLSRHEIQSNLKKIADCIREHNPDIVTLQEVDQSSVLSGSFNQFEWLQIHLQYPYAYFAPSCSIVFFGKNLFVSGNAILSRYPLENDESYTFDLSFPTDRMGFVIADAKLPEDRTLSIISVHLVGLDWLRINSRARQLQFVESAMAARAGSMVIAGDLNCDFLGKENSIRSFIKRLDLGVYEPDNNALPTHPSWNPRERIDWILLSKDLQFTTYKTLDTRLSDHLAVFATISL